MERVTDLLPALAVLATMPLYLLLRRRLPEDPDVVRRSEGALLPRWLHGWLFWLASPIERAAVRGRLPPEFFNYVGLAFASGAGLAFAGGRLAAGGWLFLLSGLADVLDGRVARATGTSSDFGAFLDSTLDRFAEVAVVAGIAWSFRDRPVWMLAALVTLAASLLVSYARARGQSLGVDVSGGLVRRGERLVMLAAAGIFDGVATRGMGARPGALLAAAVAVVGAGALATSVYRTVAVARRLRSRSGTSLPPERAPAATNPSRSPAAAPSTGTPSDPGAPASSK